MSCLNALIKHEQIETTLPKAKELKVAIDKIITLGKKNTLASKRILISRLQDQNIVKSWKLKQHKIVKMVKIFSNLTS